MKKIIRWKIISVAMVLATLIAASPVNALALEIYPNSLSIDTTSVNLTRNQMTELSQLTVNTGDLLRVTLYIVNNTDGGFSNGFLQANLTSGLAYVPGSTIINGVSQADGIASGGIMLNTLPQNSAMTITFQVRFTPSVGSAQQEQQVADSLTVGGVTYSGGSDHYILAGSGSPAPVQQTVTSTPQATPSQAQTAPSPAASVGSAGHSGNMASLPVSSGSDLAAAFGTNTALAAGAPIVAGAFTASTGPQYPWLVYGGIAGVLSVLIYLAVVVLRKRRSVRQ